MLADIFQTLPPHVLTAVFLGLSVIAVFSLCAGLLVVLQIWDRIRPKTDIYVTRVEFDAGMLEHRAARTDLREQIDRNMANSNANFNAVGVKLDTLTHSVNEQLTSLERGMGRIEGMMKGDHHG